MKGQFYRPCRVKDDPFLEHDYEDAIFHRFEKVSELTSYEDDDGLHTVVTSRIVGIVECADGQVILADPETIQFVDGFAERIVNRYRDGEAGSLTASKHEGLRQSCVYIDEVRTQDDKGDNV